MQGGSDDLKKITQEIYKKNLELFNANRQLSILQNLYSIIVSTLSIDELSQKFINTMVNDLDLYSGVVFLKSKKGKQLRLCGLSDSKPNPLIELIKGIDKPEVSFNEIDNIIIKAYRNKKSLETSDLKSVLYPIVASVDIDTLSNVLPIRGIIVKPIPLGSRILGVYVCFLKQSLDNLAEFERLVLDRCATVFGVAIDRLMTYQSLQIANKKLIDLDKQKDEFLNMAAHELRAPMTAIKGYISMIIEGDAGEIPEKARKYLADANAVTDRLVRLVNNMLNVSRIEEGRLIYQIEKENLSVPVQSVFNQFRPEAERKELDYVLDIPRDIKDRVEIDPDRIQEVIGNLVSNAIKYTEKGFVRLSLTQKDNSTVRFEVSDSGPGISEEELKKLFGKFYRAESSVGKTTGTGLGLYISKLLLEKFGGKIGVNSELGKGSIFWFELPVVD